MTLQAFQEQLKRALVSEDPAAVKFLWGGPAPKRLEVYQNNIHTSWAQTLEHDFPLTRAQFDSNAWQDLQTRYFAKHPPRHWELNTSLTPFVSFLQDEKLPKSVKELADYEWQDLQIFIDRSTVKKKSGRSNPTIRVSVYHHQIFNWVEAQAPKDQPPEARPEVLLFYRDARHTCHIREADPLMLLMIEHFKTPNAMLETLEPVRRRLLPQNTVPLQTVLNALTADEIILR